jgi:hypothetical protein
MPWSKKPDWLNKPRFRAETLITEKHDDQLSFSVKTELRAQVVALAYLRGMNGSYAAIARDLLTKAVRQYISTELDPDEVNEYNRILEAARAGLMLSKMKRLDRIRRPAVQESAMTIESETEMLPGPVNLTDDFDPPESAEDN